MLLCEVDVVGSNIETSFLAKTEQCLHGCTIGCQGLSERKVSANYMNGESSRSHSVFTCIIENIRVCYSIKSTKLTRLNLVDLAGCERCIDFMVEFVLAVHK